MSTEYSWWAELRHGGCLITPSRLTEHFPETLDPLPRHLADRLRREVTALEAASVERLATLLDTVLETILDLTPTQWKKATDVPGEYSIKSVTGEREPGSEVGRIQPQGHNKRDEKQIESMRHLSPRTTLSIVDRPFHFS